MGTLGKLRLGGCEFGVTNASIRANLLLGGDFYWSIDIHCWERVEYGDEISPYLHSEDLLALRNRGIRRWTDVIGQTLSWKEGYNEEHEQSEALFYVHSHSDVSDSTLEFLGSPQVPVIRWRGKTECDIEELEDDDGVCVFFVETKVKFEGYQTWRIPQADAIGELRRWVTEEEFKTPRPGVNDTLLFEPMEKQD